MFREDYIFGTEVEVLKRTKNRIGFAIGVYDTDFFWDVLLKKISGCSVSVGEMRIEAVSL